MRKQVVNHVPVERKFITCGEAVELSKTPGQRIFWRPDNAVNWLRPASDPAEILEN